jgi:hypothetical protein
MIALIQHSDLALNTFLLMAHRKPAMMTAVLPTLRERLLVAIETIDLFMDASTEHIKV